MDPGRPRFDIFVCSHSADFERLRELLPRLRPYGRVHLASSFLTRAEIEAVEPLYDVLHEPYHSDDGYDNFALFCIRDLNRAARTPWFIKIDCDVALSRDWIGYVEEGLAEHPDAVLFGTHSGTNRVEYDISGPLIERRLGTNVRVREGLKVNGSFYVGRTDFFQAHDRTMQVLHDLLYAFRDGRRFRPSHLPDDGIEGNLPATDLVRLRGTCRSREGIVKEDDLRSLTVHAVGAANLMFVRDGGARIVLPDKVVAPPRIKLASKWVRRRLGIPMRIK